MPTEEWKNTTVTISRGELADIISQNIALVVDAAKVSNNAKMAPWLKELLLEYSACVATDIFNKVDEEEEM